jgi:hypothetical protein
MQPDCGLPRLGCRHARAVVAPRASLGLLSRRAESHKTGVYILAGEDPASPGRSAVYIGEGDDVLQRLLSHDRSEDKEFWDRVLLFVSKDDNLTKAHARYLEAKLIALATDAKRCTVMNRTAPDGGALPEADAADMDELVGQLRILSSILGVQAFEAAPATASGGGGSKTENSPAATFRMEGNGYSATCQVIDGEFVVQSGSVARLEEAPTLSASSRATRKELLAAAVLQRDATGLRFTQNYAFGSPSGSAQVICGANVNGRTSWRLPSGETFAEWQDAQLAIAGASPSEPAR